MFEVITPGGTPSQPSGSGMPPSRTSSGQTVPPIGTAAPAANAATVSLDEALKGGEGAKIAQFSVSDISKGSAGARPQSAVNAPTAGTSVALGGMLSGKVVVDLMDALIPAAIVLLFHRFGIETKKTALQLTQAEKNTLVPIWEACLNSINLNFDSPWQTLAVTVIVIYGGKAGEIGGVSFLDQKAAKTTPAAPGPAVVKPPIVTPFNAPKNDGIVVSVVKSNSDTTSFHPDGPRTWTEHDIQQVVKRRKCSRAKAAQWLEKNWASMGGQI